MYICVLCQNAFQPAQLFPRFRVKQKMLRELKVFFYYLVYYAMLYGFPIVYIFLLVFTLALKERDSKLKIREITACLFKKLF